MAAHGADGSTRRAKGPRDEGSTPRSHRTGADVSVVICAYTEDRWDLLCASVHSVMGQTVVPRELFLSIDHNPALYDRCRRQWEETGAGLPVRVVENRYEGRLGSARSTAAELATGEILAFLDDDAWAEPDWLEQMVAPFDDQKVIAVGGCPLPEFSRPRPGWFPLECDWVFGCAYRGLPTEVAPIRHVIGAAMAVRRADLAAVGYFHSDDHDDMDMSHRLLHRSPEKEIVFVPDAVVHHYVAANRVTWGYYWRRCFWVNRGKVGAYRQMGAARNLRAERQFAMRSVTAGLRTAAGDLLRGDPASLLRFGALCAGLLLAGLGYATGTLEWMLTGRKVTPVPRYEPSPERGDGKASRAI
jgi:glucosyl-dolichyl phosphate glucuronosyltransferase